MVSILVLMDILRNPTILGFLALLGLFDVMLAVIFICFEGMADCVFQLDYIY